MNKYEDYLIRKIDYALESRDNYSKNYRILLYEEIMGAVHFSCTMELIDNDAFTRLNKKAIKIL